MCFLCFLCVSTFLCFYMNFTAEKIPYKQTGSFSRLVLDYLDGTASLKEFYNYLPDAEGLKKATADRKNFPVNRKVLVEVLSEQYKDLEKSDKLKANIDELLSENTFTVCTAHQPNIFTGHLYFIYKILHAVKLTAELSELMPDKKFVPVYYMGTEDADLEELGEVHINGTKYHWKTTQTGAVGRMLIDKNFLEIIDAIAGQLSSEKYGDEIVSAIRNFYTEGTRLETATFHFVHSLFNKYGLVILLPDNKKLKQEFALVVMKEIAEQFSQKAVATTVSGFPAEYKVQAAGREINLFYLKDNTRERIEQDANGFTIANSDLKFTNDAFAQELQKHPERFSPNVILRPVFQEMILPDVAFIGGGGELAYWLELKNVFEEANAFFPALVLRNSFALINKNTADNIQKLGFKPTDFFKSEIQLNEMLVRRETALQLDLKEEKEALKSVYDKIKTEASAIDNTLSNHVHALLTQATNRINILEKKMLKAEKKKFEAQQRQIRKIKSVLYPEGVLQERSDNILDYIARYGNNFIDTLYKNSDGSAQSFTLLTEQ